MNRPPLIALLAALLCVPLLAGNNYRVGGPQQSSQSEPLGRYAFVPIESIGWPMRVSPDGYVFGDFKLWHPVRGVIEAGGDGWFQDINNSNRAIVVRPGTNGELSSLRSLDTGDETTIDSDLPPPDERITDGNILSRTRISSGPPAVVLNDLGQTVGYVNEFWRYTVEHPTNNVQTSGVIVFSWAGRWGSGHTQLLSLEDSVALPGGVTYAEVGYGQFTTDQKVLLGVRTSADTSHSIVWDLANSTALVGEGGQQLFVNNTGLTVSQKPSSSPAIEILGQGVIGHGTANAITDSQPPPYNTAEYPMIVGSSGGFPRIWSRFKDEEGNKVWAEIDPCSPDQKYSGTLTAANSNGLIVGRLSISNQQPKAYLLVPASLAVDANRDGFIKFSGNLHDTNLTAVPPDRTSEAEPFRFWVNNDQDAHNENGGEEVVPAVALDCDDDEMNSMRDMEDFARLRLHMGGLCQLVSEGKLLVGLRWTNVTGTNAPSIKVFQHVETNGGTAYLTNTTAAEQQRLDDSGTAIREALKNKDNQHQSVNTGGTFIFNPGFFSDLSETNSTKNLLFEGCTEGRGELVITLHNTNGTEVGEGPGVWLDIMDIKKMYERATATPDTEVKPYQSDSSTFDDSGFHFDAETHTPSPGEEKKVLVFVHGWNMSSNDYLSFSETMFKRLWHEGFKGRFCAFRWATLTSLDSYNTSEYRAWKYGRSLKSYMESLPGDYAKSVAAHSMGNVVVGSALQRGMSINRYFLMEAAIPGGCYNDAVNNYSLFTTADQASPTSDTAIDLGYRLYLQGAYSKVAKIVNFFNRFDFALATGNYPIVGATSWEQNQISYKPDANAILHGNKVYAYESGPPNTPYPLGQRCFLWNISQQPFNARFVTDIHESMAFVARPRSKAIGAEPNSSSVFASSIDLGSYGYGNSREDHSGQFARSIQNVGNFYKVIWDEIK